jgi:hypothetical protein
MSPSFLKEPNGQKLEVQQVSALRIFQNVVSLCYFCPGRKKKDLEQFSLT